MNYLVPGKDWVFYALDGGIWKTYVCGRSGSISAHTDTVETTGPGSGDWKDFEATVHSFTANIDGVIALNVSGSLTLADLQALQFSKTRILCRFTQTSLSHDTYTKEAYFYIVDSTDTGSFDGVATFSIQLQGTGAITAIFTPPTPNSGEVFRYPAMGSTAPVTPGATTVTVPGLANKNIIGVFKDGVANNDIILAGTPVEKEVKYTSSGTDGIFEWAIPFDGENWYVEYQNL